MADPLSLVASVIAIATAAGQISKAISRLKHIGELPSQVYALKNEVSDLEVVLRQVRYALEQKTWTPDNRQESLDVILVRTKTQLTDLTKALEKVANTLAASKTKVFRRSALWWKWKTVFQTFQGDIRAIKESLIVMLGASNSQDLQHIILELGQVTLLTSKSDQNLSDHHLALRARIDQQYEGLHERLDALGQLILSGKLGVGTSPGNKPYQDMPLHERERNKSRTLDTLRVQISHRVPCRKWCPCACHAKQKLKVTVPGVMESLLGKMFVGYSGVPVLNKPCDFRGCKDKQNLSATMEYWFPWWLVSMNLKLQLKYTQMAGPRLQLATTRRVPDSSQSINFAMKGDIEGLKFLFSQGLASPRDVSDSRGYSLIRWALYGGMHQYKTVQFLLDQGAHVDQISYDNVWDFLFRRKCNEAETQALRCITEGGEGDWIEEQNFPLVHRIIFGLSSKSLADELEESPAAVYLTDAQGRTALDWATARVQLEDVTTLLSYGADPDNMDITGRTPVLHAVDSHSIPCLRLILEAGGDPNPTMPKGIFRSSPLTAAGFAGMAEMLELLLDFDADPNAYNPEGLTALHSVAHTHNVECALLLLEYGANLNATSHNGMTPLTVAIIHNNHQVLQLFVDRCFEYITTTRLKGPQLLPVVAEHADLETISILASSKPLRLSYDLSTDSITTNQRLLEQRRDYDEKLAEAFETLISIAQAEEVMAWSEDSLAESGLVFTSARSSFHSEIAGAMANLEDYAWDSDLEESAHSRRDKSEVLGGTPSLM